MSKALVNLLFAVLFVVVIAVIVKIGADQMSNVASCMFDPTLAYCTKQ